MSISFSGRTARIWCFLLAGGVSVALAMGLGGQVMASVHSYRASETRTWFFDIPAQDLRTALQSWSEVTGLDWAHVGGSLQGIRSPGVTGTLSGREALGRILANTGLTYDVLPSGGIAIVCITGKTAV